MINKSVDNPLPGYHNNDKTKRIKSFINNNATSTSFEGSSGLTLGLILKENSEFQVIVIIFQYYCLY